jgi:hypothetical protein
LLCVLTHRRLKPGSYDAFREAWRPDDWWPDYARGYHLRSLDDPDEVISFAFYDTTIERFEAMRDDPAWMAAEEQRLQRLAPLELSMRIGGVYEVAEDIASG